MAALAAAALEEAAAAAAAAEAAAKKGAAAAALAAAEDEAAAAAAAALVAAKEEAAVAAVAAAAKEEAAGAAAVAAAREAAAAAQLPSEAAGSSDAHAGPFVSPSVEIAISPSDEIGEIDTISFASLSEIPISGPSLSEVPISGRAPRAEIDTGLSAARAAAAAMGDARSFPELTAALCRAAAWPMWRLGSAPARLLRLLSVRLVALVSSVLPGERPAHRAPSHCLGCSS